jgi:hypothetical protein
MQTVVLNSDSKAELKLLTDLAKKLGIKVKYLTGEEKEEIGLAMAIKQGNVGEYVDAGIFIEKLRK